MGKEKEEKDTPYMFAYQRYACEKVTIPVTCDPIVAPVTAIVMLHT